MKTMTKKAAAKPARHAAQPSEDDINRMIATDNALSFKSDADAVLVNLSLTVPVSRSELYKTLHKKGVTFDDAYLQRLLAFLSEKRRAVATVKGDMWKRT